MGREVGVRSSQVTYRVRAGRGKRYVTNPDGTVDAISETAEGPTIVARLREPFASVVAEPFDAKRLADAMAGLEVYNPEALQLVRRLDRRKRLGKTPNDNATRR